MLPAEPCGPREGLWRKLLEPEKMGWPRSARPPCRPRRAVFVLSASLQCCLVAFRSSSIVQGYERTENGLPWGAQRAQLYRVSPLTQFGLQLVCERDDGGMWLKKETLQGTKRLSRF